MDKPQVSCRGRKRGFTLLEMAFVLVVAGILLSLLVPTAGGLHKKSMIEDDRRILGNLREVLMGQFLATGRLPACLDATGAVSAGNCDAARSLGWLGVRVTDSRGTPIRYDARNAAGTDLTTTDFTTVCTALDAAITGPSATPATCHQAPDYDQPASWPGYCATTDPVAFILVGTGSNRDGQSGETAGSTATVLGNRNIGVDRVFENPARRHDETRHYDDLSEVVTLQQLRLAANKRCP